MFESCVLTDDNDEFQSLGDICLSSVLTSLSTVCLPYPLDLIRTQQQANVLKQPSVLRGIVSIWSRLGVRGLYKGVSWVFCFDAPATVCYFVSYTKSKQLATTLGLYTRGTQSLSSSLVEGAGRPLVDSARQHCTESAVHAVVQHSAPHRTGHSAARRTPRLLEGLRGEPGHHRTHVLALLAQL